MPLVGSGDAGPEGSADGSPVVAGGSEGVAVVGSAVAVGSSLTGAALEVGVCPEVTVSVGVSAGVVGEHPAKGAASAPAAITAIDGRRKTLPMRFSSMATMQTHPRLSVKGGPAGPVG